MELFLLQLAAEDMFPNKLHHQAQIIYLRHKDDKNDTLIPVSDYANDTKKSMEAINNSVTLAKENGNQLIELVHLLYSLLDSDGLIYEILNNI